MYEQFNAVSSTYSIVPYERSSVWIVVCAVSVFQTVLESALEKERLRRSLHLYN
jgi:hypothetical protein